MKQKNKLNFHFRLLFKFVSFQNKSDSFEAISLFQLPKICRIYVANLLLSAVKIDRDQKIVNKAKLFYFLFYS